MVWTSLILTLLENLTPHVGILKNNKIYWLRRRTPLAQIPNFHAYSNVENGNDPKKKFVNETVQIVNDQKPSTLLVRQLENERKLCEIFMSENPTTK